MSRLPLGLSWCQMYWEMSVSGGDSLHGGHSTFKFHMFSPQEEMIPKSKCHGLGRAHLPRWGSESAMKRLQSRRNSRNDRGLESTDHAAVCAGPYAGLSGARRVLSWRLRSRRTSTRFCARPKRLCLESSTCVSGLQPVVACLFSASL